MGAFFLIQKTPSKDCLSLLERFRNHFSLQGFTDPEILSNERYDLYVYKKIDTNNENVYRSDDGGFCVCTGTLIYDGKTGVAALEALYKNFQPESFNSDELYGAYCIVISKNHKDYLFIDRLGVYKVFKDSDGQCWSSSFLALSESLKKLSLNTQCIYEYVFQGANYAEETVFNEVGLVNPDYLYELGAKVTTRSMTDTLVANNDNQDLDYHLDTNSRNLLDIYGNIKSAFGANIDTALSGGYDSRLTLALLLDQGLKPKVHVYGKSSDVDVKIALLIDEQESLGLKHIDKSATPTVSREEFAGIVEQNFYAFDGLPSDGIFDNGKDLASRRQRCANGELMLNGGGGEVFRNFFYLWDKRFSTKQFLWGFYNRFDPAACSRRFNENIYYSKLQQKVKKVLHTDRDMLQRAQIELLYPLFRCRYWMGKNNSVNNRFGYALTPFIDYRIVKDAVAIPMKFKNFGNFEGMLINRINSRLAAYPSAYGHSFSHEAPLEKKLKEVATYMRPSILRKYLFRIKTRKSKAVLPYYLSPEYRGNVLQDGFVYGHEFFKTNLINDNEQFNRLCTLEYVFQRLSPNVA